VGDRAGSGGHQFGTFAQLLVEELLPLHVGMVPGHQAGEPVLHQCRQLSARAELQVLPQVLVTQAGQRHMFGHGSAFGGAACGRVGVVQQQRADVSHLVFTRAAPLDDLHRQPQRRACTHVGAQSGAAACV
jgi:hypothetical protein